VAAGMPGRAKSGWKGPDFMVGKFAAALSAAIVATALAGATPATSQTARGDAVAGGKLAQEWCSGCHDVDAKSTQARDAAPSFLAIARMPSTTVMSLQVWLETPHPRMPNWELTSEQIADLDTYILSLRGAKSQ
jgi:mono/diheme cytochrome c family protein